MRISLYAALAGCAFRRQRAYPIANLAGLATNAVFGYIRAAIFPALYAGSAQLGGYDLAGALTYVWVTQALAMTLAYWAWWDVELTIRSGDIALDLARPVPLLGYWLARDYGRAGYYLLYRALPVLLIGQLLSGLQWPTRPLTWLAVAVSVVLAVTVSFAWRFLLNLSAFWTIDARGLGTIALGISQLLGGFLVPLTYFPAPLQPLLFALPFAAMTQAPVDVFVERVTGQQLVLTLAKQLLWAVALLGCAQLALRAGTRRLVTQGG